MSILTSRILSAAVEVAWVASLVFRLARPTSPLCYYMANYNILVLILYWGVNILMAMAIVGVLVAKNEDSSTVVELGKALKEARKSWYHRLSNAFDYLVLLFLGITGISWGGFVAVAGYLVLSTALLSVVSGNENDTEKPAPPASIVH